MKGAIVYRGKYGATCQYAFWLGEELLIPVIDLELTNPNQLLQYDYLIAGSSVYMGKLLNKNWLEQYVEQLRHKKLFLFVVCGTPLSDKKKLSNIVSNSIPRVLADQSGIYFLRGRVIMSKLSWYDRFMLKMGARLENDPVQKKEMVKDFDGVKKEHLSSLLQDIQLFRLQYSASGQEAVVEQTLLAKPR